MGIVFEYPSIYLVLCLLAGIVYAFFLYFFDKKRKTSPRLILFLAVLRFMAVFLISALLLSPMIRRNIKSIEKPVVIIGIDNSSSIVQTPDSASVRVQLPQMVNRLIDKLENKCEVKVFTFGEKLSNHFPGDFKDKETDMASFIEEMETRYSNRNTGALIIASDGLYNKGTDPFYSARKIDYPIYTIALGDTTRKKDALVRKILVSKTVYKGDQLQVEAITEVDKLSGSKTMARLLEGEKVLAEKEIRVTDDRTITKTTFSIHAEKAGHFRYTVEVAPVEGEVNLKNNRMDFYVEVSETRQKIALVYDAPHPDISALVKALEGSPRFEISLFNLKEFDPVKVHYDLIILYQLPSIAGVADLKKITETGTSLLFVLGSNSDINAFNNLKTGLIITAKPGNFNDVQPSFNPGFSLFTLEPNDPPLFSEFPPLQAPFGLYQSVSTAEILFFQRTGSVITRDPLLVFIREMQRKTGVLTGENIWRWRLANYARENNTEAFDRLINKTVHFLAVAEDKSLFRIMAEPRFDENDPVVMEAELFNASYELINDPEVNITITDRDGRNYPFVFNRTNQSYFLNAGILPPGNYTYVASTKVGQNRYEKKGVFFIEPINAEFYDLVADHPLLYRIANSHGGRMVYPAQVETIADHLLQRDDLKSVAINERKFSDLTGAPWLFILIVTLLTLEWIVRKREGL